MSNDRGWLVKIEILELQWNRAIVSFTTIFDSGYNLVFVWFVFRYLE